MNAIVTYFKEAVEELNQVRWPTRQQAIRLSIIVTSFSLVTALVFGGLDFGLSELLKFMLSFLS